VSAGGAGKVTAEWMIDGEMYDDVFSLDISRFEKFHSELNFITERVTESLGNLYAMHWPFKQHTTSRNQKLMPYHDYLLKKGACFGQAAAYERPMWYAINGNEPKYKYSYGYQNWYESAEYETVNARKNVALFDLSPFAKFELVGSKAHSSLQYLCSNNIKNESGEITYTQMLNSKGGIESDLTVTCIDKNVFRVVTGSGVRTHDKKHILKYLDSSVSLQDITDDFACFGIFGPKSRDLLTEIFGNYFSNVDFKFGTGKKITKDGIVMWFQRISYVGELGWEIYIPVVESKQIYETIINLEKKYGLVHAGAHAMDIMRMEKGYLHWGHDISPAENPYEAGLGFAIKLNKKEDFIGKKYLIKNKNVKKKKLLMFVLEDAKPGNPLLLHDEPIYHNGQIVGETTSGNYSFIYDKNLTFGYVNNNFQLDENNTIFEIEVSKKKYKTSVLAKPLHDPGNEFTKK
jgi:4-methylaminobutanoate oxidase (formaldehyde-forming)